MRRLSSCRWGARRGTQRRSEAETGRPVQDRLASSPFLAALSHKSVSHLDATHQERVVAPSGRSGPFRSVWRLSRGILTSLACSISWRNRASGLPGTTGNLVLKSALCALCKWCPVGWRHRVPVTSSLSHRPRKNRSETSAAIHGLGGRRIDARNILILLRPPSRTPGSTRPGTRTLGRFSSGSKRTTAGPCDRRLHQGRLRVFERKWRVSHWTSPEYCGRWTSTSFSLAVGPTPLAATAAFLFATPCPTLLHWSHSTSRPPVPFTHPVPCGTFVSTSLQRSASCPP